MRPNTRSLAIKLLVSTVVIVSTLMLGFGLIVNTSKVWEEIREFDWSLLPVIIILTMLNYLLRSLRWSLAVGHLKAANLPLAWNILIYLSGGAFVLTPWRSGEFIRCLYQRRLSGLSMTRSASIIMVERFVDTGIILMLTASGFVFFSDSAWYVLLAVLALAAVMISILGSAIFWSGATKFGKAFGGTRLSFVHDIHTAFQEIWTGRLMTAFVSLGILAWCVECITVFLVFRGLASGGSIELLGQVVFIHPLSTLLGSLTFLPAGIGVTESSSISLFASVSTTPVEMAAAAVLLSRAIIIGEVFSLGLISNLILVLSRRGTERALRVDGEALDSVVRSQIN